MSSFSVVVFDECHHASGNHNYLKLLELVKDTDPAYRPRLVGLTASPCKAGTVLEARKGLAELLKSFGDNTVLYRPKLDCTSQAQDISVAVDDTPEQLEIAKGLWHEIEELCGVLGITKGASRAASSLDDLMDANSIAKIKGFAREIGLEGETSSARGGRLPDASRELMRLLSAWENNTVLGPYAARWYMNDSAIPRRGCDAVSVHSNVPKHLLSSQLMELEKRLAGAGEDVRCLIFVDTKDTAELLANRLQVTFPNLSPSKAVGQAGRGMTLLEQRQVIRRFREGTCRLIVCTSVLEEGFDVPSCNLVFRIFGRASLIQQVQSRGRARAAQGKLVTISSTSCQDRAKELRKQESNLEVALSMESEKGSKAMLKICPGAFGPAPDSSRKGTAEDNTDTEDGDEVVTTQSIDDVLAKCEEIPVEGSDDATTGQDQDQEEFGRSQLSSVAFKMFLLLQHDRARRAPAEILRSLVETGLVQQASGGEANDCLRIDVRPPGGANLDLGAGSNVLPDMATVAIVSIPTGSRRLFKKLASTWNFEVKGAEEISLALPPLASSWTRSRSAAGGDNDFQEGSILTIKGIEKVSVGYMPQHGIFHPCRELSISRPPEHCGFAYHSMEIESGKTWALVASSAASHKPSQHTGEVKITAPIFLMGPCVYMSAISQLHARATVVVYFTLRSTPSVLHRPDGGAKWCRAASSVQPRQGPVSPHDAAQVAEEHLCLVATHPVVAVEFEETRWDEIVGALQDPRNLGIPAIVTRIYQYHVPNSNSYRRGECHLVDDKALRNGLERDAAVTDALLAFACLESHTYCLPLHPRCLATIFKDVKGALGAYAEGSDIGKAHLLASAKAMQDLFAEVSAGGYPFIDAAAMYLEHVRVSMASGNSIHADGDAAKDEYFRNARVVATPSRLVCMPSVTMKSSRLMRLFAPSYRLVYVTFRDEDGQPLYSKSVYKSRYQKMLEPQGIPARQMQGLHLRLLVCSASQMREQTAVFVVSSSAEEVDRMRAQLIPSPCIRGWTMFKYMSRLGLFCTAEFPVMDIASDGWEEMPDAKGAGKAKVLTDGSGYIDRELLAEFPTSVVPDGCCAIQIRHSGNKGVLVAKPVSEAVREGKRIIMRESMVKFQSTHNELCVVKAATYNKLRLNRDVLNLLFSLAGEGVNGGDWEPFPVLFAMQEEELSRMAMILTDHEAAKSELIQHKVFDRSHLDSLERHGEVFPNEGHFRRLLQQIYDYKVRDLRAKTHIPVQQGALLMGIPDPLQVLGDGQVFIQVREGGVEEPAECIEGPVLVYRNPLLHPGDMRVLDAVKCPALAAYVNVVVFPAKDGESARCIPSECSGGDLDGDMFSCIWDPKLVPPAHREVEPLDYEELARVASQRGSSASAQNLTIAESVALSMTNTCLGKLARLHLAVSDIEKDGARSDLAIQLANQQSLAVDYPKTGVAPEVPKAAKELVKQHGYPDFMESKDKGSRVSDKPLGKLFQRCCSIVHENSLGSVHGRAEQPPRPDPSYVTEGCSSYLSWAEDAFELYKKLVQTAMLQFGLRSEEELILAMPSELPDWLSSKRDVVDRALRDTWQKIRDKMRSVFSATDGAQQDRMCDKASAWYQVAYDSTRWVSAKSGRWCDCLYLGFPWILSNYLAEIRESKYSVAPGSLRPLRLLIAGRDAKTQWAAQKSLLASVIQSRMAAFQTLREAITERLASGRGPDANGQGAVSESVFIFGSVSHFLCLPDSDLDVYFHHQPVNNPAESQSACIERGVLEHSVCPALEGIALWKRLNEGIASGVPVLSFRMDCCGEEVSVDICARPDGRYKSMLLRKLFRQDPCYLPFLASVMDWARACALIRCVDDEASRACAPMKSGELHALVLHVLQKHICPSQANSNSDYSGLPSLSGVVDLCIEASPAGDGECPAPVEEPAAAEFHYLAHADSCDPSKLGRLLLLFFQAGSRLPHGDDLRYTWPVPCQPQPVHTIKKDVVCEVARHCAHAHHCLARAGSWEAVLDGAAQSVDTVQDFEMKLSAALSQSIRDVADFHALRLQVFTKAEVCFDLAPGGNVIIRARGVPRQLQALRSNVARLVRTGRVVGMVQCRKGVYFMNGCTFLFARGATTSSAMLSIHPYLFDGISSHHFTNEASGVALRTAPCDPPSRWREEFVAELARKVIDQAALVSDSNGDASDLADSLRMSVHFGHFYLLHATQSLEGKLAAVPLTTVAEALEGLCSRKGYGRPDFDPGSLPKGYEGPSLAPLEPAEDPATSDGESSSGDFGQGIMASQPEQVRGASRRAATKLNSGFYNSIIPWRIEGQAAHATLVADCRVWADAVFKDLGYEEVVAQQSPGNPQARGGASSSAPVQLAHTWYVEVVASASYQVGVKLDDEVQVVQVGERPVRWIHGTLLQDNPHGIDGRPQNAATTAWKPLDMRVKLTTRKELLPGDPLYEKACPEV